MTRTQELDELIVQTKQKLYGLCTGKPTELMLLIDKLEQYTIERYECERLLKR